MKGVNYLMDAAEEYGIKETATGMAKAVEKVTAPTAPSFKNVKSFFSKLGYTRPGDFAYCLIHKMDNGSWEDVRNLERFWRLTQPNSGVTGSPVNSSVEDCFNVWRRWIASGRSVFEMRSILKGNKISSEAVSGLFMVLSSGVGFRRLNAALALGRKAPSVLHNLLRETKTSEIVRLSKLSGAYLRWLPYNGRLSMESAKENLLAWREISKGRDILCAAKVPSTNWNLIEGITAKTQKGRLVQFGRRLADIPEVQTSQIFGWNKVVEGNRLTFTCCWPDEVTSLVEEASMSSIPRSVGAQVVNVKEVVALCLAAIKSSEHGEKIDGATFVSITRVARIFAGEQRVKNFLSSVDPSSFHDMGVFEPTGNLQAWGDLILRVRPSSIGAMEIFRLASVWDEIEKALGQVPSSLAHLRTAKIVDSENIWSVYKACYGVSDSTAIACKDLLVKASPCFAEPVLIESDNRSIEFLHHKDPLGTILGNITFCCQSIGGVGVECLRHGVVSPLGGFVAVRDERGQVVAQSWVWANKELGAICFDNIEARGQFENRGWIAELYELMADHFLCLDWCRIVTVGTGYSDVDLPWNQVASGVSPFDYSGYRDSASQRVIRAKPWCNNRNSLHILVSSTDYTEEA